MTHPLSSQLHSMRNGESIRIGQWKFRKHFGLFYQGRGYKVGLDVHGVLMVTGRLAG